MAEGLINAFHSDRYEAFSAGTEPSSVNPYVFKAMNKIGIDLSQHYSKSIDEFTGQQFDFVVTVCDNAKETCPYFPGGKEKIHKSFPDPSALKGDEETILIETGKIRDEIKDWLNRTFI
jgi:arsenate reductase